MISKASIWWRTGVAVLILAASACTDTTAAGPTTATTTAALAAGDDFTCALSTTGAASCWGAGLQGELGDGAAHASNTPVPVSGGPYQSIAAAYRTACGVRSDGSVDCWGELPDGDSTLVPQRVPGSVRFAQVSVGTLMMACGIATAGGAYCWGANREAELGIGITTDTLIPSPTAVADGRDLVSLDAGVFGGCGLKGDGSAWCWGANLLGELGIDDPDWDTVAAQPVPVSGGLRFLSLTASSAYACGVTFAGAAMCWGNNESGQLGDGTTTNRPAPTPVAGGLSFVRLFGGPKNSVIGHTCGLDASGAASCWGRNDRGQLGASGAEACASFGGFDCALEPVQVQSSLTFQTLALGEAHTCGMTADRTVYCWGSNQYGQLGDGTNIDRPAPVPTQFTP